METIVRNEMSSAEQMTSEMKRLILKCRSLESKLEQSVPRKTYQDAVQKMQVAIDTLSADLSRTRDELHQTESLGGRINSLSAQLSVLSSHIASQEELVKILSEKQTVPAETHEKAFVRIADLEEKLASSVPKEDYEIARRRISELELQIADSVPKRDYTRLMDEIYGLISIRSEDTQPVTLNANLQKITGDVKGDVAEPRTIGPELSQTREIDSGKKNDDEFKFANTDYCARNAEKFLQDLERIPVTSLEMHTQNGDFEKWFGNSLGDIVSSCDMRVLRESGITGEALRQKAIALIRTRFSGS